MNAKRKAELQRKLAMAPVAKPPAGLAERIKNDIPEYLRADADRVRLTRSVSFNMRVAAAVLVIISSAIGAIYLLEPQEELSKIATSAPQPARAATTTYARQTDEVQVEITQEAPAAPVMQVANVTTSAAEGRRLERADTAAVGGVSGGYAMAAADSIVAEAAPPPPPAAPPAAAPAPEPVSFADTTTATVAAEAEPQRATARLAAPSLVREAHAAEVKSGPADSVFGISVDQGVFHRLKETLEANKRPTASDVNVEAIINYFAGAPAKTVKRGVKLEAEGSPSPVEKIGHSGYLRFTVDTASADSRLPVAANAKVEIDLNGKVVEHAQPVGNTAMLAHEDALLHNLSVTGLYELTLRPNLRASDRVATIRLSYTDLTDGKPKNLEKTVYARDFAKRWTTATRRHRLASLGAVWGQSLKSTSPAPEVARRAEELATQAPEDARAKELATAATASSKLNSGF